MLMVQNQYKQHAPEQQWIFSLTFYLILLNMKHPLFSTNSFANLFRRKQKDPPVHSQYSRLPSSPTVRIAPLRVSNPRNSNQTGLRVTATNSTPSRKPSTRTPSRSTPPLRASKNPNSYNPSPAPRTRTLDPRASSARRTPSASRWRSSNCEIRGVSWSEVYLPRNSLSSKLCWASRRRNLSPCVTYA